MTDADRILALLYDRREGYTALTELARAAGVGIPGVKKALDALARGGQQFEWSPSTGVRLSRPAKPTPHLIERDLATHRVGRHVICFDEVASTNDVALDAAGQGGADGLAVLAEAQTAGRGRLGRRWLSPPGANILLSTLLLDSPPDQPPAEGLTIAAGLAVCEAIETSGATDAEVKWPNDVLVDGRKVAGVLIETRRTAGERAAAVGIGVNVNAAPPAERVDAPATCLADVLGSPVERVDVACELLGRLDGWVARLAAGQTDLLHRRFVARCRMIGRRVTVAVGPHRYTGRVLDVDPAAGLVLQDDEGATCRLPAEGATILP